MRFCMQSFISLLITHNTFIFCVVLDIHSNGRVNMTHLYWIDSLNESIHLNAIQFRVRVRLSSAPQPECYLAQIYLNIMKKSKKKSFIYWFIFKKEDEKRKIQFVHHESPLSAVRSVHTYAWRHHAPSSAGVLQRDKRRREKRMRCFKKIKLNKKRNSFKGTR